MSTSHEDLTPQQHNLSDPDVYLKIKYPEFKHIEFGSTAIWDYCISAASDIDSSLREVSYRAFQELIKNSIREDLHRCTTRLRTKVANRPKCLLHIDVPGLACFLTAKRKAAEWAHLSKRLDEAQLGLPADISLPIQQKVLLQKYRNVMWCCAVELQAQLSETLDIVIGLETNFSENVFLRSELATTRLMLDSANRDLRQSNDRETQAAKELQKNLQERVLTERDLTSAKGESEMLKIELQDLKNQRDHFSLLSRRRKEHDTDMPSVPDVAGSELATSLPSPRAVPSTGPNGSVHIPGFLFAEARSVSAISAAGIRQGTPTLKQLLTLIPSKTCHTLILLAAILLILYTTLSVIYTKGGTDLGGGFALGSYLVNATALVEMAMAAYHYPHCRCWKKKMPEWSS